MITRADVEQAAARIEGRLRRTPVLTTTLNTPTGELPVALKLEHTQVSGTFKARGMTNAVLHAQETGTLGSGIVIASGGNAGIAAAVAGRTADVPVTVAVPENAPAAKIAKLERLGADVVKAGATHATSNQWADDFATRTGAFRLHAYNQDDVVAGAGTVALEIADQVPDVGSIIVAVGGGGLIGGVATAGVAHTVAVEPVGAPTLHAALAAGEPTDVEVDTVAADSLGAVRIGQISWECCRDANLSSVLVPDRALLEAQQMLWDDYCLLVEPAAATAVAALTHGAWTPDRTGTVAIVLCGANIEHQFPRL